MHQLRRFYIANMLAPMPLRTKLRLTARNLWLRLYRRRLCCGHPGEPGC